MTLFPPTYYTRQGLRNDPGTLAVKWRLTTTLLAHAETPAQIPDVLVVLGDEVVVVGDAVVVVCDVVVVVVGVETPETGHVFPRTVVIHDDVASGY